MAFASRSTAALNLKKTNVSMICLSVFLGRDWKEAKLQHTIEECLSFG
jgi:hypothetical protein